MNAMWGKDVLDALERDAWEHRLIALWEGLSWEEKTFIEGHVQRERFGQQISQSNAQSPYLNAQQNSWLFRGFNS